MTFSNSKSKKLNILAKINYPGRIIGCLLMGLIICAVLYEGKFFFSWIFVVFHGLFWPHIAYVLCVISKDSKKAELRNLFIDSFFIGLWIPILSFQIIPLGMLIIAVCADNAFSGGFKLFIKGALLIIFGAITGLLLLGDLEITFESSLIVEFISVINITIYLSVLGLQGNRQSNLLIQIRGQLMETKNTAEMAKKVAEQATKESQKALEETRSKEQEIAHINQVVQAVNSTLDFDEVMTTIMHVLQDIFNFDQIGIFLKDEQGKNLYLAKYYGKGLKEEILESAKQLDFKLEKDVSYICRTFITEKPYCVSPVTSDLVEYFFPTDKELYEINPVKAYFLAPLFLQSQVIGTIVFSDTNEAFTLSDKQVETIQQYVSQIATSINNASLYNDLEIRVQERTIGLEKALQETKAKEQEIAQINQVVQAVNSTLDLDEIMISVMEALKDIFDFNQISIWLINSKKKSLELSRWYGEGATVEMREVFGGFPLSLEWDDVYFIKSVRKGKPYYVSPITPELVELYSDRDRQMFNWNPHISILITPLEVQKEIIGIINFVHTEIPFHLKEAAINQIQRHVSQIATAVNNARLAEELKISKEIAEEATKFKSEFLASMSHEIRTPMNTIIGMTELLSEKNLPAEQMDYVQTINASGELLLSIINDILDFSKIEAGQINLEKTVFDINDLVHAAGKILAIRAQEKGLKFDCRVASNVRHFRIGDPTRLRQIFINLMGNAIKFTDQGEVALEVIESDDPELLQFCVSDTGIGIPAEKQQAIFDSFSQADTSTTRKFGGTGLGLAICKRLVELMDGRIWIESEEGKGARFYFTARLEATDQDHPRNLKTVRKAEEIILPPLQILLAEDIEANIKIMKLYLKDSPVTLDIAENGKIAVEKFFSNTYDVVLMDIEMPEMDGLEATRVIRKWEQENEKLKTPIIALTAHAFGEQKKKCFDVGCTGFLTKPLKKKYLLATLEELFREKIRDDAVLAPDIGKK